MIKKQCEYCGKTMLLEQSKRNQRFCSRSCASRGVREADIDRDYDWEKLPGRLWKCRYVESGEVACTSRRCNKCGWNPAVAEARLASYQSKLTGENMEESYGKQCGPA